MFRTLFKKRELGDKIIIIKDIKMFGPFGDERLIPKGTICYNYGIPMPTDRYGNSYIELKLLTPIKKGIDVVDRLVFKRNSKVIKTYHDEEDNNQRTN